MYSSAVLLIFRAGRFYMLPRKYTASRNVLSLNSLVCHSPRKTIRGSLVAWWQGGPKYWVRMSSALPRSTATSNWISRVYYNSGEYRSPPGPPRDEHRERNFVMLSARYPGEPAGKTNVACMQWMYVCIMYIREHANYYDRRYTRRQVRVHEPAREMESAPGFYEILHGLLCFTTRKERPEELSRKRVSISYNRYLSEIT